MFVQESSVVTVGSAMKDAVEPLKDAVSAVWQIITGNSLLTFWVGTTVLSSGFWALRKAKRLVQ